MGSFSFLLRFFFPSAVLFPTHLLCTVFYLTLVLLYTNDSVSFGFYVVYPARKHQTLPTTVDILHYTVILLGLKLQYL